MFCSTAKVVLGLVSVALIHGWLPAQDAAAAAPAQKPDPQVLLQKALHKMSRLGNLTYRTSEKQDNATQRQLMRRAGGMMGGARNVIVKGSLADGVLHATLNSGEDEVLMHKGRMLARTPDEEWKPRRGRLYSGAAAPFILDPHSFFESLAMLPKAQRKIRRTDVITVKEKKLTIISITLDGESAQDFALSGALPKVSSGFGGGIMMIGGAGGMGRKTEPPDLTVDLAIYIDAESGYVYRVRSSTYQEDQGMGNVQIAIGGMGGGDEEEEEDEEDEDEVKERDKDGKRIYKNGLPVRNLGKELSKMEFGLRFSDHGMPVNLKLDHRCRALLRLSGTNK